jgi:hypothetical protein
VTRCGWDGWAGLKKKNVEKTVVVVIEQSTSGRSKLHKPEFSLCPVTVLKMNARFFCDLFEEHVWGSR